MSIAQRVFLHTRALSTSVINGFVNQKRAEDEQLDFKHIPWEKGKGIEAAKDVAAFANHLGGDLMLGISTKNDCASGWNPIPNADLVSVEDSIRQALISHLRPQEIAEIVEIAKVPATKADHSVIVVSVPPFRQLVGVEERASDKLTLQFPIRTGNRTRFLTFDEVMNRSSATTRGSFIRLKDLIGTFAVGAEVGIGFSSPILNQCGQAVKEPEMGDNGIYGCIVSLTADVLTLKLKPPRGVGSRFDYVVAVPLEIVIAAWIDKKFPSQVPFISLALDANVVWNCQYWQLDTGRFR